MPELLVATPLRNSAVTRPYDFADGISIRELVPILWDISIVKNYISEDERAKMADAKYWLCASRDYEYDFGDTGRELFTKARHAAWALQVICPSGAPHVFLKFQKTDGGYDNIGTERPKELCRTLLGNLLSVEKQGLQEDFDAVYAGIRRAFTEKVVRLQNPVLLIEHGMQTGHVNLGALMFVMGLDMLFMAGETGAFMSRVGGFLGVESYVFPPVTSLNIRPTTVVGDVLNDLYEFRNIIAHGQEIPETPYRQKSDLMSTGGQRINYEDYHRAELLLESGLFMLTASLRRIFVEKLFDEVKDTGKWRTKMRLYEHRYKESGGPEANKQRGR
jgi:hypothetical protein